MKTKGVVGDMTGAIANSDDDHEMTDRDLGVARAWVGRSVSVNFHLC